MNNNEATVFIDYNKINGIMKPLHGVNNGPNRKKEQDTNMSISNFISFKEAGFPFSRTHDSMYYSGYGLNHTIDVLNIFSDFNKDPYDANNYDFICTDEYIKTIIDSDAEVFYRLGTSIEHFNKKYHSLPPKDFKKYAIICEHIIRHYNEGWANGFKYNLKYFEIWNEPDTHTDGFAHVDDPSWGGTPTEFYEFFNIIYYHLKECFPNLMIGGPALGFPKDDWMDNFLLSLKDKSLSFLSWHRYFNTPYKMVEYSKIVRDKLDKYGFNNTLSILSEWNYINGWFGENFIYSIESIKNIKGASFCQAVMSLSEYLPIDMMLYYDARPCGFNGLFDTDIPSIKLKGYYSFYNYNKLYKLENCLNAVSYDDDVFVCASKNKKEGGILITYYNNGDTLPKKNIKIKIDNIFSANKYKLVYFLTNNDFDNKIVKEQIVDTENNILVLTLDLFDCYYIKVQEL